MEPMIKLDIKQNAFYTFYHAIEHLHSVIGGDYDENGNYAFDDDAQVWGSRTSFFIGDIFQHPPNRYEIKFALQHFFQALELFVLARLMEYDKDSIFSNHKFQITIKLDEAITRLNTFEQNLFDESQRYFIKKTKYLRNKLEHFEINIPLRHGYHLCWQLRQIISYLCFRFWEIRIEKYFEYDLVKDKDLSIANLKYPLMSFLKRSSEIINLEEITKTWLQSYPNDILVQSICCNEKSFSTLKEICIICKDKSWLIEQLTNYNDFIIFTVKNEDYMLGNFNGLSVPMQRTLDYIQYVIGRQWFSYLQIPPHVLRGSHSLTLEALVRRGYLEADRLIGCGSVYYRLK